MELNFDQTLLESLASYRSPLVTSVFQAITFMGGVEGYLLVIALIYACFDKQLAVKASVVVLLTMIVNHLLKSALKNPRPFTVDGSYTEVWAVSESRAAELAAEFSTPSGHAMAAAAFYAFLIARLPAPGIRVLLALAILLIGVSRPLLGVHYVEDVLLGWVLGIGLALMLHTRLDGLWDRWTVAPAALRLSVAVLGSVAVWLSTIALTGRSAAQLPTEFVSVLGFLSGVVVAAPFEASAVRFRSGSGGWMRRGAGFLVMLGMLGGLLAVFELLAPEFDPRQGVLAALWRYLEYTLVGAAGVLAVPWVLLRARLGSTDSQPQVLAASGGR